MWKFVGVPQGASNDSGVVDDYDDIFWLFRSTSAETLHRRPALSAVCRRTDKVQQESRAVAGNRTMPLQNSKYRNLQRHCAVLRTIARLSC